jgi:hypothetical protein
MDDAPLSKTFLNFLIISLMYMDYIITLIYLVDWVTWVSNLEGENVTESPSYMFVSMDQEP